MDSPDDDLTGFFPARVIADGLGKTRQCIQNAAKDGRISPHNYRREKNGRWHFHVDAIDEFVDNRTKGTSGGSTAAEYALTRLRAQQLKANLSPGLERKPAEERQQSTAEVQLFKAELRAKHATAEEKELKVAERSKQLMERAKATQMMLRLGKSFRQSVLEVPARICDRVAAMTDAFEVRRLMLHEITECIQGHLEELRENASTDMEEADDGREGE